LAVFGTTGEANSLSVRERKALLDELVSHGVEAGRLLVGTGCCSLSDVAELTLHAVKAGCAGVLMLPPFYYKAVTDEGLFRSVSETIERVADNRLRVYLYHIPPVATVGFSIELIGRLVEAYPGIVIGIKDSSGDWDHTRLLIGAFPGFGVFSGNEFSLVDNLKYGGCGCITATANVNAFAIRKLFDSWHHDNADMLQQRVNDTRAILGRFPMISALKGVISRFRDDEGWRVVRPPLVELTNHVVEGLLNTLVSQGFVMPDISGEDE